MAQTWLSTDTWQRIKVIPATNSQFLRDPVPPGLEWYLLHAVCFAMWASVSVLVESHFSESLSDTQMSQVHRIDTVYMHPAATSGACPIITVCVLSMDEVVLSAGFLSILLLFVYW